MSASTQIRTVPAYIETGQVVDVDIQNYTVAAVTQFTKKPLTGLAFSTPYQHYANGEGIYFMPEVGSLVWICFPSDGGKAFILGWAPARDDEGSLRANRMQLNPGDIYLGTRDENFLILRRGGVVQVGGGPLSQRMYFPVNNTIKDFCENYELHALGGDLEWSVDVPEASTDGKRPTLLRLKARQYANDEEPVALLEIGSHQGDEQSILTLTIRASGAKGAATKISLDFRKDGSSNWDFKKNVSWKVAETFSMRAKKIALEAETAAEVKGATVLLEATTGTADIKAAAAINITAGAAVNVGPTLNVGAAVPGQPPTPALMADPAFLTWLLTHTHPSAPPGPPSPPNQPTGTGFISKKIFGS